MPDHLKFKVLHQLETIVDRSLTQFLRDMRRKYQAAGEVSNTSLHYAFALHLPPDVTNVIFSFDTKDFDTAALRVEKLYNTTNKPSPSVDNIDSQCNNHVHSLQQPNSNLLDDCDHSILANTLIEKLNLIAEKVNIIDHRQNAVEKTKQSFNKTAFKNQQRNTPFTNSPPPTCPPTPSKLYWMGLCYYHALFGNKANKCGGDCSWFQFNMPQQDCKATKCHWTKYNRNSQGN